MVHFIGNILTSHEAAAAHPERDSKQFHITPDEAASIDATGLPVHLEHAGNVMVGKVARSWNDSDGSKWVLADVDESTIAGKYVRNDLASRSPVYGGLSLQHMYREYADGSSSKEPLEVSICKDPRRPGCRIVHATTERPRYKVERHRQRTMSTATDPTENALVADEGKPTVVAASAQPTRPTPSATQLMAEVVEASRQNDELQKQLAEKSAEVEKLNQREQDAQKAALAQQTQMAQELGDAVLEHVAKLDPALANEDTALAISTLRDKYPKEIARVMEVACCASNHAKKLEEQLAESKESTDRKLMEQAYHAAVATRSGCHGVSAEAPVETMVQASKRARHNPFAAYQGDAGSSAPPVASPETLQQIQEAYNGLKGSGSTADAMRDVAGIMTQQRERGFR